MVGQLGRQCRVTVTTITTIAPYLARHARDERERPKDVVFDDAILDEDAQHLGRSAYLGPTARYSNAAVVYIAARATLLV